MELQQPGAQRRLQTKAFHFRKPGSRIWDAVLAISGEVHTEPTSPLTVLPWISQAATKHHQNKCCSVMGNLKVIGMTGIQDPVFRKNSQPHGSCSGRSSTCLMHVKNKPSKVGLVLPSSANPRYKFKAL